MHHQDIEEGREREGQRQHKRREERPSERAESRERVCYTEEDNTQRCVCVLQSQRRGADTGREESTETHGTYICMCAHIAFPTSERKQGVPTYDHRCPPQGKSDRYFFFLENGVLSLLCVCVRGCCACSAMNIYLCGCVWCCCVCVCVCGVVERCFVMIW